MLFTIAIICKNEERNIERCLVSIFQILKDYENCEVLLVDSYSTDDTLKIASQFPVKIIRLRKEWPHSAAAGRYTAFRHAAGKYTLIIDADMELLPGFLEPALDCLDENPLVGAVAGIVEHKVHHELGRVATNVSRGELAAVNPQAWAPESSGLVKSVPGAGLFRTEAVLRVGNFHPYLRAEEEYELCQRLRRSGFELRYLPIKVANHYGYLDVRLQELVRRLRRGHMLGTGDMLKWSITHGFVMENLLRFRVYVVLAAYLAVLPVALIGLISSRYYLLSWLAGLCLFLAALIVSKKGVGNGLHAFVFKMTMALSIVLKLPVKIREPDCYPTDVIIIDLSAPGSLNQ
jgi:glycosyltransferase involved in cell wall biosynthesis